MANSPTAERCAHAVRLSGQTQLRSEQHETRPKRQGTEPEGDYDCIQPHLAGPGNIESIEVVIHESHATRYAVMVEETEMGHGYDNDGAHEEQA